MKGAEIVRELQAYSGNRHLFIKWWRKENDFADYELVGSFLRQKIDELEFDGYQLLDMNQMWSLLKRHAAERVDIAQRGGKQLLVWQHADGSKESLPFNAETLLEVFDAETRGDVLM